jgi:uncharacterized membrane protein
MSLIKLASRLSEDDLYAKAYHSAFKKVKDKTDNFHINMKAQKISNRYNRMADYIKNRNIKRGLIGSAIGLGLVGAGVAYSKNKDKK